jgi:RING-type zinc-finger
MKTLSLKLLKSFKNSKSEAIENQEIENCPICYEAELDEKNGQTVKLDCGHQFCRNCLFEDAKIKIQSKKLDDLVCPEALCRS